MCLYSTCGPGRSRYFMETYKNKIASFKRKLGGLRQQCFCYKKGSRYANVNIVVEWKGMLAEGAVVWNDQKKTMLWK